MKYLNTFEDTIWHTIEIGDLVVVDKNNYADGYYIKQTEDFISTNVGEIVGLTDIMAKVQYLNIPDDSYLYNKYNITKIYRRHLRLATRQEIENYNIQKDEIKYNL